MGELDPAFARRMAAQNVDRETLAAVAEDIQSFLSDINRTDGQLQRDTKEEGDIFTEARHASKENKALNA